MVINLHWFVEDRLRPHLDSTNSGDARVLFRE